MSDHQSDCKLNGHDTGDVEAYPPDGISHDGPCDCGKWNEMVMKTNLSWRDRFKILRKGSIELRLLWRSHDDSMYTDSPSITVINL